ncbi:choice-of-anchor D domain-containing protein, partial [Candidatus Binatus sp.]|uniref:choice-of-anchor D domain-containing protein n=1 Tax=Candidatus Binatus sp. TaxID=2811406 RepID=UPI003C6AA2A7
MALSRPTVLALAFVALLGTIAALPASAAAAGLKVTPTSLAFGNLVFGVTGATSVAHTVTISDPAAGLPISSLSIQLTGANSGDFQISDNTCGATLSKGSNCTLKVTFTPTALGARSATLAVSDDANLNACWAALSGTGIAGKLTIRPLTSSFGKVLVGATSAAKMTTVENPTAATFQIASVVASGEFTIASDTCSGDELPPGASCAVKAVFNPTQTGALSGNLIITDDAANSPQSVTLEGSGILANPTFSPLSLAFGRVQVGSVSAVKTVTITNPNIVPVNVGSMSATVPFELVSDSCGSAISAGGNCQVSVTFNPTTDTNSTRTVETGKLIVSDDGKTASQSVS